MANETENQIQLTDEQKRELLSALRHGVKRGSQINHLAPALLKPHDKPAENPADKKLGLMCLTS